MNDTPNNATFEQEQQLLLSQLPETFVPDYLADNLQILLETLFEGDGYSSGQPLRISGDQQKLLYEIHAWLQAQKQINQRRGRPRKWNSVQEKNKYYNDKRRGKLE